MYIPAYFHNKDNDDVKDFIHANGFAILVSEVNGRPWATHIPMILDKSADNRDILTGHISKANRQWKDFKSNREVLAIFNGPNAYISSSWYDHENVPTWNYIAVHVYGKIRITRGDILKEHMSKLVDRYESGMEKPVSLSGMSEGYLEKELKGIVGFEIEISDIQAVKKLSQNRDEYNKDRIISELERRGDAGSLEIAALMRKGKSTNP